MKLEFLGAAHEVTGSWSLRISMYWWTAVWNRDRICMSIRRYR